MVTQHMSNLGLPLFRRRLKARIGNDFKIFPIVLIKAPLAFSTSSNVGLACFHTVQPKPLPLATRCPILVSYVLSYFWCYITYLRPALDNDHFLASPAGVEPIAYSFITPQVTNASSSHFFHLYAHIPKFYTPTVTG
uniref:Uncharacterized protein n=1 Tax=Octopus bimaculoides TaxID=37653 RepID=A0A0L8HRN0_OCTBM